MLDGVLTQLDVGCVPAPSGAGAVLLHAEEGADCYLALMVMDGNGRRTPALVTFVGCRQSVFGYPNDEAYSGVPGATYGCFEVTGSTWREDLRAFNMRRFPDTPMSDARHFFVGCHDASGQFLAQEVKVETSEGDYASVLAEAVGRTSPLPPD